LQLLYDSNLQIWSKVAVSNHYVSSFNRLLPS
jgi:hypothetical protein